MRKTGLAIAAILSLCGGLSGVALADDGLSLVSEVDAIELVALQTLPDAPGDRGDFDLCSHLAMTPDTQGGALAEDRGWIVTGEVALDGYDAVSFIGSFGVGTSGSCERLDGNVGIFRAGELVALAYAPDATTRAISLITPLEAGGARIWDGDYLPYPVADLQIGDDGMAIVELAAIDQVCGGAAEVPNIYGMPIGEARTLLQQHGWTPWSGDEVQQFDHRAADYRDQGLIEVGSCSGTGFGFCSFGYENKAGELFVTTVGDAEPSPAVSSYGVECR